MYKSFVRDAVPKTDQLCFTKSNLKREILIFPLQLSPVRKQALTQSGEESRKFSLLLARCSKIIPLLKTVSLFYQLNQTDYQ